MSHVSPSSEQRIRKRAFSDSKDDQCERDPCEYPISLSDELRCIQTPRKSCTPQSRESPFARLPKSVVDFYASKGIKDLYDWQEDLLQQDHVVRGGNFLYSLPTSGGKTLVSEILLLQTVFYRKARVDYKSPRDMSPASPFYSQNTRSPQQFCTGMLILPFVSLVEEKTAALRALTKNSLVLGSYEVAVEAYCGTNGLMPPPPAPALYVCTIEKASGVINALFQQGRINELQTVVIDEFHMVGETGGRGITLELLVSKLLSGAKHIQLIGMSATIPNLTDLSRWIGGESFVYEFRPIELKSHVVCDGVASLSEDFENSKSEDKVMKAEPNAVKSEKKAGPKEADVVVDLVDEIFLHHSTVVFCPTKANAEATAYSLAEHLWLRRKSAGADVETLFDKTLRTDALDADVNFTSSLAKLLPFRVAYHHSGLTSEERRVIENAFHEKRIFLLCCTSTLAAGVNLPVRRVIIRSPYVGTSFIKKSQYLQMIGRAGRAGFDEFGESYLVCNRKDRAQVYNLIQATVEPIQSAIPSCPSRETIVNDQYFLRSMLAPRLEYVLAKFVLEIVGCSICALQFHVLNCFSNLFGYTHNADLLESAGFEAINILLQNKFISLQNTIHSSAQGDLPTQGTSRNHYALTKLGESAMRSNLALPDAFIIYYELNQVMSTGLVLTSELHILYMLTPLRDSLEPDWRVYERIYGNLGQQDLQIAEKINVSEAIIQKRAVGIRQRASSKAEERMLFVTERFWTTLVLCDLLNEMPMNLLTAKYQITTVAAQNVMRTASYFAHGMAIVCESMEWFALQSLIASFVSRLGHGVKPDLLPLMAVNGIQSSRARVLCQAGLTTIKDLASSTPEDVYVRVQNILQKRSEASKKPNRMFFTISTARMLVKNANISLAELSLRAKNDLKSLSQ